MSEQNTPTLSETWIIYVSGYGTCFFKGTRKEAEEFRKAKKEWEGGMVARKRLATPEETEPGKKPKRLEAKEHVKG